MADERTPTWAYDAEAGAGYLRLREGAVGGSEAAGDARYVVDASESGETLGIEVLASEDAALLDAWLARVRRDAWQEGYDRAQAVHCDAIQPCDVTTPNPYEETP